MGTYEPFQYGIIVCGSEILSGKRKDKHFDLITHALSPNGMHCCKFEVVGDKFDDLTDSVKLSFKRYALTLVTGGLGPTVDDITRECISEATGIALEEHPDVIQMIQDRFHRMGRKMKENNRIQALVPVQGSYFYNHNGTAPGLIYDNNENVVIALPGPPRELNPMINKQVLPFLKERFGVEDRKISRSFYFCGLGESDIDHALRPELQKYPEVEISSLAHFGMIDITLSLPEKNAENLQILETFGGFLHKRFHEYIYSEEHFLLEECVGHLLKERNQTISVAESCTGGLLGSKLTDIEGSSSYFVGGIIAYSNQVKQEKLGVSAETLEAHGAVSEEVATEMALGVKKQFDSDWGVSITGIAGPSGGTVEKPVGTVWAAVADIQNQVYPFQLSLPGSREWVRQRSSVYALDQVRRLVVGEKPYRKKE